MDKKKIAVVMGGYSSESDISLISGKLVFDSIDREKYQVYRVIILENEWYMEDDHGLKIPINRNDFSVPIGEGKNMKFDVCFNMVIGNPGENGQIQAYWDQIGQHYTGCNSKLSALTFSKKETLEYLSKFSIPSAKRHTYLRGDSINAQKVISQIGLPLFVKPNASGSSFGISKVYKKEDFQQALEEAFKEDDEIIIESFLKGTQVSVGVNRYEGKAVILGITEIIPFGDFFDRAAKYEGQAQEITPARLDSETYKKVEEIAKHAYNSLEMNTVSRSEFIIMDGIPYMLEMNTNPGFTPTSILPQQIKHFGMTITEFCSLEIEKTYERHSILLESEQQKMTMEKSIPIEQPALLI